MKETLGYFKVLDRVEKATRTLTSRAATLAVNFSKERFRAQNWVDNRTEPWPKRKTRQKGKQRALLVQSGRGRRSIRKVSVTYDKAIVGTDVVYMKPHNEGFKGNVTVRRHTRQGREGRTTVKSHTRRMNIPQRKFLGASVILDQQISRMMTTEITKAIRGN